MSQDLPNKPKITFPANTEIGTEQSPFTILEEILKLKNRKSKIA